MEWNNNLTPLLTVFDWGPSCMVENLWMKPPGLLRLPILTPPDLRENLHASAVCGCDTCSSYSWCPARLLSGGVESSSSSGGPFGGFFPVQCLGVDFAYTLPEPTIEPENGCLEGDPFLFGRLPGRCYVCFVACILFSPRTMGGEMIRFDSYINICIVFLKDGLKPPTRCKCKILLRDFP